MNFVRSHRLLGGLAHTILGALLLLTPLSPANAQEGNARLFLRPHCAETDQATCPSFTVQDPLTLKTDPLSAGGTLDMDLVVDNRDADAIKRVRATIAYDPSVLEGVSIETAPEFPNAVPGEKDFAPEEGYIKLDVSTDDGSESTDRRVFVARIQLKVLDDTSRGGSALSFYDVQPGGHTVVVALEDGSDKDILGIEPGVLLVTFGDTPSTDEAESVPEEFAFDEPLPPVEDPPELEELTFDEPVFEEPITEESEIAAPQEGILEPVFEELPDLPEIPEVETIDQATVDKTVEAITDIQAGTFALLQPRNVGVTTEGSTIYLGWDPLGSSQLQGYNIYYGTLSGQYIQRKSVASVQNSLTLRGLPTGTTYYFAVRGVSVADEESAFSQEVAITVGDPRTSSSPLSAIQAQLTQGNPVSGPGGAVSVPGETGLGSIALVALLISASIGTLFAWKRQCIVAPTQS